MNFIQKQTIENSNNHFSELSANVQNNYASQGNQKLDLSIAGSQKNLSKQNQYSSQLP